jgi:hypothetical protein
MAGLDGHACIDCLVIVSSFLAHTASSAFGGVRFLADVLQLLACLVTAVSALVSDPSVLVTFVAASGVDNEVSVLHLAHGVAVVFVQLVLLLGTLSREE